MIICDIDGTLFNNHHRKHLIPSIKNVTTNWHDFNSQHVDDEPVQHVIDMVIGMARNNDHITFLTSRTKLFKDTTSNQLVNAFRGFGKFKYDLIMRPVDDHRNTLDFKHDELTWLSQIGLTGPNIFIDDNVTMVNHVNQAFPHYDTVLVNTKDCTLT